jgi:hypothetical protein
VVCPYYHPLLSSGAAGAAGSAVGGAITGPLNTASLLATVEGGVAGGATDNLVEQVGGMVVSGRTKPFDWGGLAAAAIGGGVSAAVGFETKGLGPASSLISGLVGGVAGDATGIAVNGYGHISLGPIAADAFTNFIIDLAVQRAQVTPGEMQAQSNIQALETSNPNPLMSSDDGPSYIQNVSAALGGDPQSPQFTDGPAGTGYGQVSVQNASLPIPQAGGYFNGQPVLTDENGNPYIVQSDGRTAHFDSDGYPQTDVAVVPIGDSSTAGAQPGAAPSQSTGDWLASEFQSGWNWLSNFNQAAGADHSFTNSLFFNQGIFKPVHYNTGVASTLVNGPINIVNSLANSFTNSLGIVTQPFDKYQGELLTYEATLGSESGPGEAIAGLAELGTTGLAATSRFLRGADVLTEASPEIPAGEQIVQDAGQLDGAAPLAAAPQLKRIEFEPGEKGAWNSTLNGPLEPNAIYVDKSSGYSYTTDDLGRVQKADANLVLDTADRNTYQQRISGGDDRLATDQGGHLIASIFGGAGEQINLVPMDANLNMGAWRSMEAGWASELEAGNGVAVQVQPIYTGTSLRPDAFGVIYQVNGGRPVTRFFNNKPGG